MTINDWGTERRQLTNAVSVLVGADNGLYPSGNSLVIEGSGEVVIIDPSVAVVAKGGAHLPIDAVINSHGHEDHVAGNGLFADARVHIHHQDLLAARSLDGLMAIYGFEGQAKTDFEQVVLNDFSYVARPDAEPFGHGHRWELGGIDVEAVHLPGHTRGHCGFRISDGVFFLSDIDLTGFGPYYGDAWSSLEQFEDSLRLVRDEEADFYVTFHHKGVIEGRAAFVELVDGFAAVIGRRHESMLSYLTEPRSLDELAQHRFVYRPHVEGSHIETIERRTASLHVDRMLVRGEAAEIDRGRFQRLA